MPIALNISPISILWNVSIILKRAKLEVQCQMCRKYICQKEENAEAASTSSDNSRVRMKGKSSKIAFSRPDNENKLLLATINRAAQQTVSVKLLFVSRRSYNELLFFAQHSSTSQTEHFLVNS